MISWLLVPVALADAEPSVHLNLTQSTIGRPQWIDLAGFDPGGVVITATHGDGHQAPTFRQEPLPMGAWLVMDRPSGSGTVDVASRVWLDVPGEWTVHVTSASHPEQEATATLTLLPATPDTAEDLVEGQLAFHHGRSPDALGHAVFVPILEARIRGGAIGRNPSDDDLFAIRALGRCPCVEGAEALLRVWDTHPDLRQVVASALVPRVVPTAPWAEPLLHDRGWNEVLGAALLERVHASFAEAPDVSSCDLLEALGDASDGPLVEAATVRALREGSGSFVRRLEALRAELGVARTSDDAAVVLLDRLLAWEPGIGAPPEGYEGALIEALGDPGEALPDVASQRLPPTPSDALVQAAVAHVGTSRIGGSVQRWLTRLPAPQGRDAITRELETADASRLAALLTTAAAVLAPDELVDRVLEHLDPGHPDPELAWVLLKAIDPTACGEWSKTRVDAGDLAVVEAAWRRVLRDRRDELHAAPLRWVPGETDPDLLPGLRCGPSAPPTE